jgi:hypothetical protein
MLCSTFGTILSLASVWIVTAQAAVQSIVA